MRSLCKTNFTQGQKDTEQAGTAAVLQWAAVMRLLELQGKAGEVGKHYRNFNYFACNAVISIRVISKSSCQQQSCWSVGRDEGWAVTAVTEVCSHMKTSCCWGTSPWFWAPATKGSVGCSSGIPQRCSHQAKRSQCRHSLRESTETALPGWANGKAVVKQVSSGTSEQQAGNWVVLKHRLWERAFWTWILHCWCHGV